MQIQLNLKVSLHCSFILVLVCSFLRTVVGETVFLSW